MRVDKSKDLKKTYDRIVKDYAKAHRLDSWAQYLTAKFLEQVPKGSKVLDLGCGPGWEAKFFSENGLEVVGIDFSSRMIELARKNAPGVKFFVMDVRELNLGPGEFEGVFAKAVLLHLRREEVPSVLGGIHRILKLGGLLHISVKEGEGEKVVIEKDWEGFDYPVERFFTFFDLDEMERYVKKAGFRIVLSERRVASPQTTWINIFAKKI